MYPVNIKMDGRACLVIGGGHVAQRKVCTLLEEKAAVTVVAPEVCSGLEALFREGRISCAGKVMRLLCVAVFVWW